MNELKEIRKLRFGVKMKLREVHKVTEYRKHNGINCVYRTKSLGMIICETDYKLLNVDDVHIGSVSTIITGQLRN